MGAKTRTPSDLTRLLFLETVPTLVCTSAEQPHLFGSEGLIQLLSSPVQHFGYWSDASLAHRTPRSEGYCASKPPAEARRCIERIVWPTTPKQMTTSPPPPHLTPIL